MKKNIWSLVLSHQTPSNAQLSSCENLNIEAQCKKQHTTEDDYIPPCTIVIVSCFLK